MKCCCLDTTTHSTHELTGLWLFRIKLMKMPSQPLGVGMAPEVPPLAEKLYLVTIVRAYRHAGNLSPFLPPLTLLEGTSASEAVWD